METDWSPTYFASGAHGWASKGLCLIDFGRGIDMKQFVPNVAFIADWKTSEADCAEMRELRPWTYQVDYHGMAGIVHSMLFGKYMETIADRGAALGQGLQVLGGCDAHAVTSRVGRVGAVVVVRPVSRNERRQSPQRQPPWGSGAPSASTTSSSMESGTPSAAVPEAEPKLDRMSRRTTPSWVSTLGPFEPSPG